MGPPLPPRRSGAFVRGVPTNRNGNFVKPKGISGFANTLFNHSTEYDSNFLQIQKIIKTTRKENRNIILSAERFDGLTIDTIYKLKELLKGYEVNIVYVYRELISHLISLHFQLNRHLQLLKLKPHQYLNFSYLY